MRRHIVSNAFAELTAARGHAPPPPEVCDAIADRFNELHEAELYMFPGAHETLDRLKELDAKMAELKRLEVEAIILCNDDLAIEHAASRQLRP